ncbi:MAG: hypothetical protein ACE15C_17455 [Phycisphaerae bacterium]
MKRGADSSPKARARKRPDIGRIFREGKLIDRALAKGVRDALIRHKKLGVPIATWKNGKVVWVPPEKI